MSSPERQRHDTNFFAHLLNIREDINFDLGKPYLSRVETEIDKWGKYYLTTIKNPLLSNPEETRSKLARLKHRLSIEENKPISNPFLCSTVVRLTSMHDLWEPAIKQEQKHNVEGFLTWFDTGFGMILSASAILTAEKILAGNFDDSLFQPIYNDSGDLPPLDQAQAYIRFSQFAWLLRQKDEEGKDEFRSGFKVVDLAEKILIESQNSDQIPSYLVKELVIAGAKSGTELYKTLYLLTKGL